MTELQGIARQKVPADKREEFKKRVAECLQIVRSKDSGTLQYEVYVNDDESEFIVLERFRDTEALLEHGANLGEVGEAILALAATSGELLGEPSAEMKASLEGSPVRLFKPFMSL